MRFFTFWPGPYPALALASVALLAWPRMLLAQAPVITAVVPMANARNASRTGPVQVTFDQALTAGSGAALKVFSAQRGGLRSNGNGTTTVSGPTMSFAPSYPFMPGETVQATVTTAATAAAGGNLARARVVQFTAAVTGGSGVFSGGSDPVVGSTPRGLTTGDIDGDGDLDLVTTEYNNGSVNVRLNNGQGIFSGGSNPIVGTYPSSVILGDVDGDGDLDLLVTIQNLTSVRLMLNDGLGVFSGGNLTPAGSGPRSVALGDMDGDGDLDLLTANFGISNPMGTTVSLRFNTGSGVFTNGYDITVGAEPSSVVVGDMDGDGDLDILAANSRSNTVSVRINGGSGNFASGSGTGGVSVGTTPYSMAVGDADGDGDLDLFTANYGSNNVSVRLNNGRGVFSGGSNVAVGNDPLSVAVGDVDGDGDLDLLAGNINTVSVLVNNGLGVFSSGSNAAVGNGTTGLAVGDVDGDGDLDLLAAINDGTTTGTVSVRLNQSQRSPTSTSLSRISGPIGTSVTLTGTNFTGATSVLFNGTPAPGFVVNSPTSITVTVPAGATTGPVTVTTPGGISNGLTFTVTGGLAVADAALRAGVSLFPNPAQGRVTVRVLAVAGATQVTATLHNALGQQVQAHTAALPAGGASLALDVSALARGVYALRLTAGTGTLVQRLVVE